MSLVLAAVFLFCWLCTLSWLTVLLHGNIQQLDEMVGRGESAWHAQVQEGLSQITCMLLSVHLPKC